uniref:Uncharacterized protein n=1 Tax=Manihot esculenta TaxID=3983 RepID=A0A2C9V6K7_MANES
MVREKITISTQTIYERPWRNKETCITRAKSEKIPHEFSTITGIQESIHEILMNLKEIVLRSNLYGTCDTFICVKGPHIASLTKTIDLCIKLQIKRNRGYRIKPTNNFNFKTRVIL